MSAFVIEVAAGPLGDAWAGMTFPMYRPLLALLGTGVADPGGSRPVARLARAGDEPVGLLVAELPTAERPSAELLSLFVVPHMRGLGVATALVASLEEDLAALGVCEVTGVYMAGKPATAALERVFEKRGFTPPQLRKVVVQCTPDEASRTEWYQHAKLPSSCVIFPWADLPLEEYEGLKRSQAEAPWIPQILEPWSCGEHFDATSSVGLRKRGEVVGWIITHRIPPNIVRYTSCFVRADLQRWGLMLPLLVASIRPLLGTDARCTFVTTDQFPEMVTFTHRRIGPFVSYCGETRGVSKSLTAIGAPVNDVLPPLVVQGDDGRDGWNGFVAACPDGHLFQSWEWGELQVGLGATPVRVAAMDNGRVVGAVQVLVFDTGSRVFSVVARGPVVDRENLLLAGRLVDAAVAVSVGAGADLVRLEPQWADNAASVVLLERRGFAAARQHIMPPRTVIVDLRPPPDAIWAAFRSNTRNRIRLAEKRGVSVREGGAGDTATFARLFEETNARHGLRLGRPDQFFLAERHFGARDTMRLFLANADGTDLAGIMVFVFGTTATYLWGASAGSAAARQLNPNQLLHWTAMQWARKRGCTAYDFFGVPDFDEDVLEAEYSRQTGGWWSLYRFKRGFGGRVHRHVGTFDCVLPRG